MEKKKKKKKSHSSGGLTMDELCQCLNQECEQVGFDQPFIGPQPTSPTSHDSVDANPAPQKFRVCTNYKKLNEVTQVLPMPQGDIRTKQQAVSGHRWISLFDFAAGFYAVEIAEESRPYTAFLCQKSWLLCLPPHALRIKLVRLAILMK